MDEVEINLKKDQARQVLYSIFPQLDSLDISISKIKYENYIEFDELLNTIFYFTEQIKLEKQSLNSCLIGLVSLKSQKINKFKNILWIIFGWVDKNKQLKNKIKNFKNEIKILTAIADNVIKRLEEKQRSIYWEILNWHQKILAENLTLKVKMTELINLQTHSDELKTTKEDQELIFKLNSEIQPNSGIEIGLEASSLSDNATTLSKKQKPNNGFWNTFN